MNAVLKPRKPSGHVYVSVEREVRVDLDDIVEELTEEQLERVMQRRANPGGGNSASLLAVYEEFIRRGDAPQCLRDYIYETIGRIL